MFHKRFPFNLRIFLGLLIVIILILLSEIIYSINNRSPLLVLYFFNRSKNYAERGDLSKAYQYLSLVADKNIEMNNKIYEDFIPRDYSSKIEFTSTKSSLQDGLIDEILNFEFKNFSTEPNDSISYLFYKFGLISNQNLNNMFFPDFLKTSIYLFPELSYYHVELSNYYLSIGQKEKSQQAIEFCLKFHSPKEHCEEYLTEYNKEGVYFTPGFLLERTEKFFVKDRIN